MENNEKEVLFSVSHLKKYFQVGNHATLKAVDDVSFEIYKGETLGMVGESGCGKTTCGRTCIGLYDKTDGQVLYKGTDVHALNGKERFAFKKQVQMVFQDPAGSLNPAFTVAQTLERGLSMVCGEPIKCTGCGRTDAGVHAEHYVANFRTDSRIPVDRLPFAVNTHIPEDIVVKAAYEVADDFNAIGSCIQKEYTYRIYNSRIKNPFYVHRAYFYPKKLDEDLMDRAARMFEGTHDFAAVRSVGTNVRSTVRTIHYCRVTRNGELLELKVCADGFLYNMVRAITGTVLYAAEGKLMPEDIPEILNSGNRTLAGPTAPPGGLYLTRVWYEDERLNG